MTMVVCLVATFMITTSAINARGTDLRPNRNTDLISVVRERAAHGHALTEQLATLQEEVNALTKAQGSDPVGTQDQAAASAAAGLTAVSGPAVSVTLTDAPLTVKPVGIDADLLVVHQQDIQSVVNALWSGGAEAMTIQGLRVTARTGIKCVGNTVVLQGIPFAPPYVITAIGDVRRLQAALASSPDVLIYKQYVDRYKLGYAERVLTSVTMPAYKGSIDLEYAKVMS